MNVEMRISSTTKSCNLSANMEIMRTSERKAKIDDFLRNSVLIVFLLLASEMLLICESNTFKCNIEMV